MEEKKKKRDLRKIRRRNAKLYPIYKMFSWDLLFFYSIEFLFYTITKKVSASDVLTISACFLISRVVMQLPAVAITDLIGKRKSIILGNFLACVYIVILILAKGLIGIIIADMVCALAYDIKLISETNLLYDSVSTRGGEGLYSKIDARGGSLYFIIDGIASMIAGYLFVTNNYLPIYICLGFLVIAFILSFGFKDVYKVKKKDHIPSVDRVKKYLKDLDNTFVFAFKSNRMKAFLLFAVIFYSTIKVVDIYRSDLLVEVGIPAEQFSMIFAILTLIGGVALSFKDKIEKQFKNRTLSFISLMYISACILIGIIVMLMARNTTAIVIILLLYIVQKMSSSIWWVLEYKYLKNFTKEDERNRLTFVYEFVTSITAGMFSILAGILLRLVKVELAFIYIGGLSLTFMLFTLKYMKTRIGLKPKEYKKEDIKITHN